MGVKVVQIFAFWLTSYKKEHYALGKKDTMRMGVKTTLYTTPRLLFYYLVSFKIAQIIMDKYHRN